MSFLYPGFLFALFSLLIPIILHLFDLQRPKKVVFTNVSLLKTVNERTSSTRKLRHFLVLVARLLFLAFLILAFAQPYLSGSKAQLLPGSLGVAVYLDNSPSMNQSTANQTLLATAIGSLNELVSLLPPSTQYLYADNIPQPKDHLWLTPEKISDRITEIKPANTTKLPAQIFQKQQFALTELGQSKQKRIFWLSDFQKSSYSDLFSIKPDSSIQFYLIPYQNNEVSNIFIDSVWLDNLFVRANETNVLKVQVRNSGNKPAPNVHLKLFINDVQSASSSIELSPNGSALAQFSFVSGTEGTQKCKITFEDEPINFDNTYYFTIATSQSIQILGISDGKSAYLKNVFSNEPAFKYNENVFGNISLFNLKEADFIAINGFDKLNASEISALNMAIEQGKNVLLIPSDQFSKANLGITKALLPLGIEPQIGNTAPLSHTLALPDVKNPLFENVFEKTDKLIDMPQVSQVFDWGNKGQLLLKTKSDLPFLSTIRVKQSNYYLCSSPLTDAFTTLHRHSLFVPVMYKLAIESARENKKLSYMFDSKALEIRTSTNCQRITMKKESLEVVPVQKLRAGVITFDMPSVPLEPGFYQILCNDSVLTEIALNTSKSESIMQFYNAEVLRKGFASVKNVVVYDNSTEISFVDTLRSNYVGVPLWKYCIVLSLCFLFAEILLIRFAKN